MTQQLHYGNDEITAIYRAMQERRSMLHFMAASFDHELHSHSYEDTDNTKRVPGYGVANLAIGYTLSEHSSVGVEIGNLFDNDYETSKDYNTLGRTLFATVSYQR